MFHHPPTGALPAIIVGETEEVRLTALATAAASNGRAVQSARILLAELERARIVRDRDMPADTVRMYSTVEFQIDQGERRRVQLVYPGEANIDDGRISILTPIGAALIGLSPGQTISMQGHDGRAHALTVSLVEAAPS